MPYELTIDQAAEQIRSKSLSPVELTESFLKRIEQVEPHIQAWVTVVREQALDQAKKAEAEIMRGNWRGPLHGIPFGAKDLYYTAGIPTNAGSRVNEGFVPSFNATVINRLFAAGAILLGKTTTTEYAFFGGPPATRNPWNTEHTPGGSSSGSAAALAASMACFTLGTQTAGSLSRPAAYNGVTALKGTYGRISRHGIIPGSWSLDHPGAFTRSVMDAAMVFEAMGGPDQKDPSTLAESVPSYQHQLTGDIKGMVVGVANSFFTDDLDPAVFKAFEEAMGIFAELGAKIVSVSLPKLLQEGNIAHSIVMKAEAAAYHQDFYQTKANLYNPDLSETLAAGHMISAVDYLRAQRIRTQFRDDLVHILGEMDALLTPAAAIPAPQGLAYTGSPLFNVPFTNAGVPTLAIPAGFAEDTGLPVGIQLAARPMAEERLLQLGHAFQSNTSWHKRRPEIKSVE